MKWSDIVDGRPFADIEGWLHPLSEYLATVLSRSQSAMRLRGNLCEIGIHHGRSFIPLYLTLVEDEKGVAVDVFRRQELNVDRSGRGDRERFLGNLARYGGRSGNLVVIEASSLELTAGQLGEHGAVRFFSIDGGHTELCTLNDLRLADGCLMDGGIVMLDDFFNEAWPGVASGMSRFLLEAPETSPLVPFAIGPNKLFCARQWHAAVYRNVLRRSCEPWYAKTERLLGHEVDIYEMRLHAHSRATAWLARAIAAVERRLDRLKAAFIPQDARG